MLNSGLCDLCDRCDKLFTNFENLGPSTCEDQASELTEVCVNLAGKLRGHLDNLRWHESRSRRESYIGRTNSQRSSESASFVAVKRVDISPLEGCASMTASVAAKESEPPKRGSWKQKLTRRASTSSKKSRSSSEAPGRGRTSKKQQQRKRGVSAVAPEATPVVVDKSMEAKRAKLSQVESRKLDKVDKVDKVDKIISIGIGRQRQVTSTSGTVAAKKGVAVGRSFQKLFTEEETVSPTVKKKVDEGLSRDLSKVVGSPSTAATATVAPMAGSKEATKKIGRKEKSAAAAR